MYDVWINLLESLLNLAYVRVYGRTTKGIATKDIDYKRNQLQKLSATNRFRTLGPLKNQKYW